MQTAEQITKTNSDPNVLYNNRQDRHIDILQIENDKLIQSFLWKKSIIYFYWSHLELIDRSTSFSVCVDLEGNLNHQHQIRECSQ